MAYTSGPWFIDDGEGKYLITNAHEASIALCFPQPEGLEVMIGNAHMVSAAPDLVEDLERALDFLETLGEPEDRETALRLRGLKRSIRDTLFKARGKR